MLGDASTVLNGVAMVALPVSLQLPVAQRVTLVMYAGRLIFVLTVGQVLKVTMHQKFEGNDRT